MTAALDWSYRAAEIPEQGLNQTREADEAERTKVASALEVLGCQGLRSDFTIRAIGRGHYRLAGKVTAQLTQSCVVTLEPVAQTAQGTFDVEFWPAGAPTDVGAEEIEALSAAEIEPIEHGRIDAGRIIFETLSAAVDPYPRKPGVEFEAGTFTADVAPEAGPFAALKKLKDQG